jgi:hypothetical protein
LPDDTRCDDGVYCNGDERCDLEVGCRPGSQRDCSDLRTCTIDACVESSRSCQHTLRDADGDGVPDGHCVDGGDCDDSDPTVFPGHPEICNNGKDDNCDGRIDEQPCATPSHDTCLDPLTIDATGVYELDTTAASFDYPGSCTPKNLTARRDVVAAIQFAGAPSDLDVVAQSASGSLALGLARTCGDPASEIACAAAPDDMVVNALTRIRVHSLAPGAYPLYVWTDSDTRVVLNVTLSAATAAPTNETCGSAATIAPGTPVIARLVGTASDLSSRCSFETGDLVYRFTLAARADVTAFASSLDNYGTPVLSLRDATCALPANEISCAQGDQPSLFARALAAGTYYLAVSASAPTDVQLELDTAAPSTAPADENCTGAPMLAPNRTIDVTLANHTDDIAVTCGPAGSKDAAYDLEIAAPSDLLLTLRVADGDTGGLSLAAPSCTEPITARACQTGTVSPVRLPLRGVSPGSYRVVAESALGNPVELTAFVRDAMPPSIVPFADTCASAITVTEPGGFFLGNTSNAQADYNAGCDVSGVGAGGAPDQMLKLVLTGRRRVILDMEGSNYFTLLDVRRGDTCPGVEVPMACSVGFSALRSYLDLTLDAGTYFLQIDGYGGDAGAWQLDVRVVAP